MRILFVISILALVALLWAAVSIAQHIRRTRRTADASEALLLPDVLVAQQAPAQAWSATEIKAHEAETPQAEEIEIHPPLEVILEQAPVQQALPPRLPPVAVTPPRRSDWAYYKEDMGDLTDPVPAHPRLRARSR